MKPFILFLLVLASLSVSAKKMSLEELKQLKANPLLVVLVTEEKEITTKKGNSDVVKSTLNDALRKAPEAWKFSSESKVITGDEFKKMSEVDRKKWTILSLGTMLEAQFKSYRVPMTGDDILYDCLFFITLNRGENSKFNLYSLTNNEYAMPMPVSTNDITGVSVNELQVWLKVIQKHIDASIAAGELLDFDKYGDMQEKLHCNDLATSKVFIPEIMKHAKISKAKYDELHNLVSLSNKSFDEKLASSSVNEYIQMSFFLQDPSTGLIAMLPQMSGNMTHVHWIVNANTGELIGSYDDQYPFIRPQEYGKGIQCK